MPRSPAPGGAVPALTWLSPAVSDGWSVLVPGADSPAPILVSKDAALPGALLLSVWLHGCCYGVVIPKSCVCPLAAISVLCRHLEPFGYGPSLIEKILSVSGEIHSLGTVTDRAASVSLSAPLADPAQLQLPLSVGLDRPEHVSGPVARIVEGLDGRPSVLVLPDDP